MKTITINRSIVFGLIAAVFAVGAFAMTSAAHAQVVTTTTISSSFAERLAEIVRQIQAIQTLLNQRIAAEAESDTEVMTEDPALEEDEQNTTGLEANSVSVSNLDDYINPDLQFLRVCFFQTDAECALTDLNDDGVTNFIDLGLFKAVEQYDLSGDGVVDLSDDGSDATILRDCFLSDVTGECEAPDFNEDGVVNFLDLGLLLAAEKYDFNNDGQVDLRDDNMQLESEDELIVSVSSSNPDPATLLLEDDSTSDWYTVLVFDLDTGDSENDIEIESIPVLLDLSSVVFLGFVNSARLVIDGQTIDDVVALSPNTDEPILLFDVDGDVVIDAGDSVQASLELRFNPLSDTLEGTTVQAQLTELNVDAIDAEGEVDLEASQLFGSALGSVHVLATVAPVITDESFTIDQNNAGDAGTISYEFTMEADGENDLDFTFGDVANVDGSADDLRFTLTGTDVTIATASIFQVGGDATASGTTGWTISEGDSADFALDVTFTTVDAADNGVYRVTIDTIEGVEIDETSDGMSLTN